MLQMPSALAIHLNKSAIILKSFRAVCNQRGGKCQHTLWHSISSAASICRQGEPVGDERHFECLSLLVDNLYLREYLVNSIIYGNTVQRVERWRDPIINTMAQWIKQVNN